MEYSGISSKELKALALPYKQRLGNGSKGGTQIGLCLTYGAARLVEEPVP